jgi:hypothetical protein
MEEREATSPHFLSTDRSKVVGWLEKEQDRNLARPTTFIAACLSL